MLRVIALLAVLLVAACGSSGSRPSSGVPGYSGGDTSCVPYARSRSGIALSGDAWEWWGAAAGRYDRSSRPQPGAVLVFRRTQRNRSGHLSVVTRVVSAREILVDHANWASGSNRGRVSRSQPVIDVSADNDWSMVRVWYPPVDAMGRSSYPTYGFIHGEALLAEAR